MSIAITVIFALLASGQNGTAANGEKRFVAPSDTLSPLLRAEAYGKRIVKVFKSVEAPVIVDLPFAIDEFYDLQSLPNDTQSLDRVSVMWDRRLSHLEGAYVVHRTLPSKYTMPGEGFAGMYEWLDDLRANHPDQFAGLVQGGMDFDDLDDDGKQVVGQFWGGAGGAAKGAVDGSPVNVSLDFMPFVIRTDGSGKQSFVPSTRPGPGRQGLPVKRTKLKRKNIRPQPFKNPGDGDLDFGPGEVLSLVDLLNRAEEKFHFQSWIDDRVQGTPVFVKGRFTKKRIIAALAQLGRVPMLSIQDTLPMAKLYELEKSVLSDLLDRFGDADPTTLTYMHKLANDGRDPLDPESLKPFGLDIPQPDPSLSVSLGMMLRVAGSYPATDENGQVRTAQSVANMMIPGR